MKFFWCLPVSRNWSLDPNEVCVSGVNHTVEVVTVILHILTDITIYLIPFPLLTVLKLNRRQKIGLAVIFGVGFLCVVFAIMISLLSWKLTNPSVPPLCTVFEYFWANIVVCLPSLKSFLKAGIWGKIKRRLTTTLTGTTVANSKDVLELQLEKGRRSTAKLGADTRTGSQPNHDEASALGIDARSGATSHSHGD